MLTVTVDTNILPIEDLVAAIAPGEFAFAMTSVTHREIEGSVNLTPGAETSRVPETLVWGESCWDGGFWGAESDTACLERALAIIADGSFPPPNRRATLNHGERSQLRDAMILCAHVREKRDIFVTDDRRAFVRNDRRVKLEQLFSTRIMTQPEFLAKFSRK
ncbi:MAG: hypothetical protein M3461_19045 [Pseudomonadota bacterium]|nr:hypothetical protein [Pseudomonadota bacterium]